MIVVLAEKPSVGRDIARVLRCTEKGEGYLKNDEYLVTWALGHLVSLCEPDELDEKYKKWKKEDLPILPKEIPIKVLPKTKQHFNLVKKIINAPETQSLICATDAGREGEYIFRLIYQKSGCKKSVQRLWISSMTDAAIREGFETLKPDSDYDGLYMSAKCRSEADWLVGMNASRAFTLRFGALLSIGRVQTPTLAILVKRQKEIETFVPEEYYTVTADFGDYTGQWINPQAENEKTAHRIFGKEEAAKIAARVRGKNAQVASVVREEKKEYSPYLYDLTSLQRDANSKFGFTAEKTLKIAQELYEKWKAITYPRTDSKFLPPDMAGRTKVALNKLPADYQVHVQNIPWKEGKLPFSKRVFDASKVSDHHAIIPTMQTAPLDKLPPDAAKVYDCIARRTLAAFYPPMEYDFVKIHTRTAEDVFVTSGRVIQKPGWKAVYEDTGKAEKNKEPLVPAVSEGEQRSVQKASAKKETTKPPAPHTDASLLSAMENAGRDVEDEAVKEQMKGSGLGTPATRAAIIERLVQVGYAVRRGRTLSATEKGIQLIQLVPEEISSAETTGKWELALHEIAENKRDTERFMDGIRKMAAFLTHYAETTEKIAAFPKEEFRKTRNGKRAAAALKPLNGVVCPLCGGKVQENSKAFGCEKWKSGCAFTLWKDTLKKGGGPALNAKIVERLLKEGSVAGSSGTISLREENIAFTPKDAQTPSIQTLIRYKAKK